MGVGRIAARIGFFRKAHYIFLFLIFLVCRQAFPCNQFGNQEPGPVAEIKSFARERGARFLIMDKIDVNGTRARVRAVLRIRIHPPPPRARSASYQGARRTMSTAF